MSYLTNLFLFSQFERFIECLLLTIEELTTQNDSSLDLSKFRQVIFQLDSFKKINASKQQV
jgi:hypothetical protein